MSCDDVTLTVSVLGIDNYRLCGPLSNVDLVYFVWEEFMRFTYKRYGLALILQGALPLLPRLMFVKHYRVESDGWKDRGNCDDCRDRKMELLLPFHACDPSSTWTCKTCSRQPPSLADCARHVLFKYTMNYFSSGTIRHMTSTCMRSVRTVCRKPPYYLQSRLGLVYGTWQALIRHFVFIAIVWSLGGHRYG